MKTVLSLFIIYISLGLFGDKVRAQKYYQVIHGIGDSTYGNRNVNFDTAGRVHYNYGIANTVCKVGPHGTGSLGIANELKYTFSEPIFFIKAQFYVLHNPEIVTVYINGTKYNLTASELTNAVCGNFNKGQILNGSLKGDTVSNAQLAINYTSGIDSIKFQHNGLGGGCVFGLVFGIDTTITIDNFHDSALCASESFNLPFRVDLNKSPGNVFTAQLSDKYGSFVSSTVLGTLVSDSSSSVFCTLPDTLSEGNGYRVRIVSSNTSDTSDDNGFDIAIGNLDSANVQVNSNSPVCVGDTLKLNISNTGSLFTYSWSGPQSMVSTLQNPRVYNASSVKSGEYYSTVKHYGCIQNDTLSVVVLPNPNTPSVSSNSAICSGDSLRLTATSTTSGVAYSWSGPNTYSSNAQHPIITNSTTLMSGIYIASVTKNGCASEDTAYVLVKPKPLHSSLSTNTPLCVGDTLKLTSTNSTSGVNYSWSGPNGFSSNTQNSSLNNVQINAAGWYKVTASINGCIEEDSSNVAIAAYPSTPVVSYNSPLCIGEGLDLSASTNFSAVSYTWSGPNNFTSNSMSPQISSSGYKDTGTYSVSVNNAGCESQVGSIKVKVNPLPFVILLSNKDTICDGESTTYNTLKSNAGNNASYKWFVNNQYVTGGSSYTTTQLKDGDVIRCDMTDTEKCNAAYTDKSNEKQITVMPWLAPSVSITVSPTGVVPQDSFISFTAHPVDAGIPSYQWKRNGQDIVGAKSKIWSANTLNNNDSICVSIGSGYRCPQPAMAESNCIGVKIATGVFDSKGLSQLKLYPNPNNGQFKIEGKVNHGGEYQLEVLNALGQSVYKKTVIGKNGSLQADIDAFMPTGTYVLKLVSINTSYTHVVRFTVSKF